MENLDTMETEWHNIDQSEINAQRQQYYDDCWDDIEAEAERMRKSTTNRKEQNELLQNPTRGS